MKIFRMLPKKEIYFKFEDNEQIPIDKHFEITKELLNFYNIPAEWIAETFNVPVEEKNIQAQTTSVMPDVANLYKNSLM